MKALEGLRVLDLSRVLAGPFSTMVLGDLGAEIIKIEQPGVGDDSRAFGPFIGEESSYFMSLNRGKKSITLNLKDDADRAVFIDLVKESDIVVENYRPGTMAKLGFEYEDLKKVNPRIIYAAISGFGHSGPYSTRPAYDMIVQAMGGIMSITGEPGQAPVRVGSSIGDITAGIFGTVGILAAVEARHTTGEGQKVDVAMLDCQVAILENAIARYLVNGEVPVPLGSRHPSITPFQAFPTKDYYVIMSAGNDALWAKLCNVMGTPELINDPKFATNRDRNDNVVELSEIISKISVTKTTAEWMDVLEKGGLPVGPINTVDKVVHDPQIEARNMIVEVEHPVAGKMKFAGNPIKLSATPGEVTVPAPTLGQHTDEILKDLLGWSEDQIGVYNAQKK
ncbi:MAG: CoA transferase [Negativicutes bacterium]|jgi:CoA:oxalate CoA-transferase|nr:CoA transferase [Negativicutes bacterium]